MKALARAHDFNGDGIIGMDEFRAMLVDQVATNKTKKQWRLLFFVSFALLSITLAILAGIIFAIVDKNKDTSVSSATNALINRHTGNVITTGSFDYCVTNEGRLVIRGSDGICPVDNANVIAVSTASYLVPLSSSLPNEFFRNLVSFDINSPSGNFVSLRTSGFVRMSSGSVILLTPVGEILIEGEQLSFSTESGEFFSRKGFEVVDTGVSGRRRLQSSTTGSGTSASSATCITCNSRSTSYSCFFTTGCVYVDLNVGILLSLYLL